MSIINEINLIKTIKREKILKNKLFKQVVENINYSAQQRIRNEKNLIN